MPTVPKPSDMMILLIALAFVMTAMVLIQVFVPAEARDPDITNALTYVATAIVGGMGGAARRSDS